MDDFKGRHFTGEVILWAVRWYCRYGISYRDLEEMLAERGIDVDHTTIYRWVQRYAPEMEKRLRWFWRRGFDPSWGRVRQCGVELGVTSGLHFQAALGVICSGCASSIIGVARAAMPSICM